MKKILLIILLTGVISSLEAQNWQYDFNTAIEKAVKENKKILMFFSGSDWCAPCMRMEKRYWTSPEFQAYAKSHFVILRVDFPRKKKNKLSPEQEEKNFQLTEKFNPENYLPFVVVLNPKGEKIGEFGYQKIPVKQLIEKIEKL